MDSALVKGHFFLGQALLEVNLYDEAITSLTRGMYVTSRVPSLKSLSYTNPVQ